MKKFCLILIVICLLGSFALSGCELVSVNEEREANQVVAKVGGVSLLKRAYTYNYNAYLNSQGITQADLDSGTDINTQLMRQMLPSQILQVMVRREVFAQEAVKLGLDQQITEEEQKKLDEDFNSLDNYYKETNYYSLRDTYKDQPDGREKAWAETLDAYQQYLDGIGVATEDGYKEMLKKELLETKLTDYYNAQVNVDDTEIQTKYDDLVKSQKEDYDATPANYQSAAGSSDSTTTVVYRPNAGFRRVKHILIKITDEESSAINAETDETKKAELRTAALEKIKSKAEEVLKKLDDGGDFNALLEEYGEDTGMKAEAGYDQGYLVYADDNTYVAEFRDAAMALAKVGDHTGLVASDFGYHIIKYMTDEPVGEIPLAEVKEKVKEDALKDKQSKNIETLYDQWCKAMQDAGQLSEYPDRLKTPTVPGK